MLRLIATLSHVANQCRIANADLLSLLRIGHAASQNIKNMRQMSSEADQFLWIERNFELFRSPLYTAFTFDKVDPPEQVPDESIMGPIALIRLLAVLAQRGVLNDIPKWHKLPAGTSQSTTLDQVKEIVGNDNLRQLLARVVKRVTGRRETGHKRIREDDDADYAGFAYSSAAELAAGIVAFDHATNEKYKDLTRGVRKEQVLCLGNAAEMALMLQQYERALNFALGAGTSAQNLTQEDTIDDRIITKNQRRAERARAGLAGREN